MKKNDITKVITWRALSLTLGFIMTYMYLREICIYRISSDN